MKTYPLSNKHYFLQIEQRKSFIYIKMQMRKSTTTTTELPHTYDMLSKVIPGIHSSLCFNNQNLPFAEEVKNTEIGHLFEHIMLEYLYLKMIRGKKRSNVVVKGETSWDWNNEPHGLFHIKFYIDKSYKRNFQTALYKSVSLLDTILETPQ